MKYLLILLIKTYWLIIPASKRRKCIFRKSCSKHVYEETISKGIISGLKAFKYRFENCTSGAHLIENPITRKLQIILPNHNILDEQEISERFIKTKNLIMGKFIITQRVNNEYQFNLKANNGEIILMSEGYVQKSSCQKGIESVKINSQEDARYDRRVAVNGKDYFVLKAGNGEIIGKSQYYSSKSSMELGISSVKINAPTAEVIDETI